MNICSLLSADISICNKQQVPNDEIDMDRAAIGLRISDYFFADNDRITTIPTGVLPPIKLPTVIAHLLPVGLTDISPTSELLLVVPVFSDSKDEQKEGEVQPLT